MTAANDGLSLPHHFLTGPLTSRLSSFLFLYAEHNNLYIIHMWLIVYGDICEGDRRWCIRVIYRIKPCWIMIFVSFLLFQWVCFSVCINSLLKCASSWLYNNMVFLFFNSIIRKCYVVIVQTYEAFINFNFILSIFIVEEVLLYDYYISVVKYRPALKTLGYRK